MRFYIHKLGCPKNDVDADYIAARLIHDGHEPVGTAEKADTVIVNTCGFILPAKEESINEILRFGQWKTEGKLRKLFAAGCLTQRYGDDMLAEIPELDGAFGHGALDSLAGAMVAPERMTQAVKIESRKLGYLTWRNRFISDSYPYAYLKISDGCDRGCTYCAIPGMRGKYRSRPLDSIMREARYLAENGKKELILVSQEATLWGCDLPGSPDIITLLKELEQLNDVKWIRLLYLYPAQLEDRVIDYLADDNKTLNYFDLPFQHVNSDVLTAMRRRVDKSRIQSIINRIRTRSKDAVLRTTFIVGFPGETEEHFSELYDFVDEYRFERMGVFTYSPEEGTPAEQFINQIPESLKQERMDILMNLQREIAFENNASQVGRTCQVLVDEIDEQGTALARSAGDCPDIDQQVFIHSSDLKIGEMPLVRIEKADGYDLIGAAL